MTGYGTSHEIEKGIWHTTGAGGRGVIMSTPISHDPLRRERFVGEPGWGQTLEDFYRINNLDEKRRTYLEDLRWQVNSISTGGPLHNLLNAMGLN
ncbi:MAG TPA: hypothetical protein VEH06_05610 [Candidatus Bathyarchaeia archaeon]|nr:hypothetical protein [Candidatus Bathyarchaeia archaeon]